MGFEMKLSGLVSTVPVFLSHQIKYYVMVDYMVRGGVKGNPGLTTSWGAFTLHDQQGTISCMKVVSGS